MADTNLAPVTSANAPRYKYYTVDLVSNELIGEIPLEDVSYEKALKQAGAFDGKITVSDQTENLNLYNVTMPGRTALFVVRDGVCVWGGIIWSRSYDLVGRSLTVSASEFTSYLSKRVIWKSYSYSFQAEVSKSKLSFVFINMLDKTLRVPFKMKDNKGNPNQVFLSFKDRSVTKFNKFYPIVGVADGAPSDPSVSGFYVRIPNLPSPKSGTYQNVTVSSRTDTYEYIRELVSDVFEDFADIDFANEIMAPGINRAIDVTAFEINSTGTYTGVSTLYTSKPHKLSKGQAVELANIHPTLVGEFFVTDIPTPSTFKVAVSHPLGTDKTEALVVESVPYTLLTAVKERIHAREIINSMRYEVTHLKRVSGLVTLTLKGSNHRFKKDDVVTVVIENAAPAIRISKTTGKQINSFNYSELNNINYITAVTPRTVSYMDPIYTDSYYDIPNTTPVKTVKNNTVSLATPRTEFRLYPTDSHGYAIGDRLKISGVDGLGWKNPVYDGYNVVTDTDPGSTFTISSYQKLGLENLLFIICNTDPDLSKNDFVTISSPDPYLNGTHRVLGESAINGGGPFYQFTVECMLDDEVDQSLVTVSGTTGSVRGRSWVMFSPVYDQLSSVTLSEPDNVAGIGKFKYVSPKTTKRDGLVYIETLARHTFGAGDKIKVKFSTDKDNKSYATGTKKIVSTGDLDQIVFSIPAATAPKNDVPWTTKQGSVTRVLSKIGSTPIVEVSVDAFKVEDGVVTVQSVDHDLAIGDYVRINFTDPTFDKYEGGDDVGEAAVKIIDANQNSFSYYLDGSLVGDTEVVVKRVHGFATDSKNREVVILDIVAAKTTEEADGGDPVTPAPEDHIFNIDSITTETFNGKEVVTYTTGTAHRIPVGSYVSVTGLPPAGERVSDTISSTTYNVTKVVYTVTPRTKNGVATLYITGDNPLLSSKAQDKITLSDFTQASGTIAGKPRTINTWGLMSTSPQSPGTSVDKVVVANSARVPGTTNQYTVKIAVSGVYSVSWTANIPTGQGKIVTTTRTKSTTTTRGFSQYNLSGNVVRVGNSVSLSLAKPSSVKDEVLNAINVSQFPGKITWRGVATTPKTGSPSASVPAPTGFAPGDIIDITGLTDVGKNLYSKINGRGQKIVFVAGTSPGPVSATDLRQRTRITVLSKTPKNSSGKRVQYQATNLSNENALISTYYKARGSAFLDYQSIDIDAKDISNISRNVNHTAVVSSPGHGFVNDDFVNIWVYGKSNVMFNGNGSPVQVQSATDNQFTYAIPGIVAGEASHIAVSKGATQRVVTFKFLGNATHKIFVGDTITLSSFDSAYVGSGKLTMNVGYQVISATPTTVSIQANSASSLANTVGLQRMPTTGTITLTTAVAKTFDEEDVDGVVLPSPMVIRQPVAFTRTYGEYPNNAGMGGMEFSTEDFSTKKSKNEILRGSSLTNVAAHLEEYSNSIEGFDYRIDCELSTDSTTGNKKFKKIFKLIPIYPEGVSDYINGLPLQDDPYDPNSNTRIPALAPGQVVPAAIFGADRLVFEYPGNITNINLSESSESSATRVFVTSNQQNAGEGESSYSGASAEDLLADGWPLLDRAERQDWPLIGNDRINIDNWGNYDSETDLFKSAKRFIYESKPPAGDFIVTVNGSLNPVIGTYSPGDWCSIVVNDKYIKTRLNSSLEPRRDIIIRKIDSIKVTVPNNPAFPEQIDLTIVPDWQVDKVGE
jgi:hypothetical protein